MKQDAAIATKWNIELNLMLSISKCNHFEEIAFLFCIILSSLITLGRLYLWIITKNKSHSAPNIDVRIKTKGTPYHMIRIHGRKDRIIFFVIHFLALCNMNIEIYWLIQFLIVVDKGPLTINTKLMIEEQDR